MPFRQHLDAEQQLALASLQLPLPSARLKLDDADPRGELVRAVLAEEGLELRQMQIKGIREMFFCAANVPPCACRANCRTNSPLTRSIADAIS